MTYVIKSVTHNQYKLKVVNQNSSLLIAPATVPVVVTAAINDLTNYSNTELMLANDATTYANAVTYANNAAHTAYVNAVAYANGAAQVAYTNAVAYAANVVANVKIATISDVVLSANPPANNSTLVYNTANNKYVVKQLDLDGGNF